MASPPSDERIVAAWEQNAAPWTAAVRAGQIASRKQITDGAILETVLARRPATVLDLGCGEGWLARELSARGVAVTGIDAVPELIERAREGGVGEFLVVSYEAIARDGLPLRADVAVCNFSLLGKEATDGLVRAAPVLLHPGGAFIVQTLHPLVACGELPYRDGWREGAWTGCGPGFREPAPWYFRTLESWLRLFTNAGLHLAALHEPLHPETGKPASILFVAEVLA